MGFSRKKVLTHADLYIETVFLVTMWRTDFRGRTGEHGCRENSWEALVGPGEAPEGCLDGTLAVHKERGGESFLKTKRWEVSKFKLQGKYELVSGVYIKRERHIFKRRKCQLWPGLSAQFSVEGVSHSIP